jgi:cation diffusion facilitator CzcD-associated flavoprotein CzcO
VASPERDAAPPREDLTAEAVVVGAGPAGLAVAACLRRAGCEPVLLEKEAAVGATWRRHYDRLHLHTDRARSSLPFLPLPRDYPRYPSRQQVVDYLEAYARALVPAPRCGEEVTAARRREGRWTVETGRAVYRARTLVLATGWNATPVRPAWPGMEAFPGAVLHSSEYRNGERFRGQDVLVVGFGNSGGEIALDLVEHGARPALAVRGPVNLLPRELLGLPILTWALALSRLPPPVADALAAPLLRLRFGDLRRLGLVKARDGALTSLRARARVPLIDVGTVDQIRAGRIRVRPGVARFAGDAVRFEGGAEDRFDAVVLATGYRPGLARLLPEAGAVLDPDGRPRTSGRETAIPGLYLCGFHVAPTGMFREIGLEARRIAADVARAARSEGGERRWHGTTRSTDPAFPSS